MAARTRGLIAVLLIALVLTCTPSAAQEDYSDMVGRVEGTDTYFRFADLPVVVCPVEGYTDTWQAALEQAVNEISTVVEMTIAAENCDVLLYLVARLPEHCTIGTIGCTWLDYVPEGDHHRMVSTVHILSHQRGKVPLLLHELMHALGVIGHSRNPADAIYASVRVNRLSEYDVEILEFLYRQKAY